MRAMTVPPVVRQLLGALLLCAAAGTAGAQAWPAKPLRVVVSYAPGGVTDLVARSIATPLGEALGQSVVVENRPGASGLIGTEVVAKSPPDGYTLLMFVDGNSMMPAALKTIQHDPVKSFAQVTLLGRGSLVLVAHPTFPAGTLQDMVQYAKKNPGELSFATPGKSGPQHLSFESLKTQGGFTALHIPYKGGGQAIVDVVAGQVKVAILGLAPSLPHIKSGKLRALAVTTRERSMALPDVPTVAESGYPGFEVAQWQGLVAPAGTPAAVISRLHAELLKVMRMPAIIEKLASIGMVNATSASPAEFTQMVQQEVDRWPGLFKAAGIQPE
jgi:tripartite-type tricarboxylate transporter receptor subunit TctC